MKEVFEKIIERLEEEVKYQNEEAELEPPFCELTFDKVRLKMAECYEHAIEIVNQVAEGCNDGWIPCSERLPTEREDVFVTSEHGGCAVAWYHNICNVWRNSSTDMMIEADILAWQPLPAPYKPKGEK